MANRYVLGADIRVTGNYKSQLNTFLNAVKRCEREFDNFTKKVVKDTKTIDDSLTKMTKTVLQYANSMSQTEKKAVTTSNALQEKMGKSVDKLGTKYEKLGKQIKDAYSNIPSETPRMNPNGRSGRNGSVDGSVSIKGLNGLLGRLFGIHVVVNTIKSYLKFQNEVAEKISSGILNLGSNILKSTNLTPNEMLTNAMDFEQVRATMNVLAKSEEKGAEVYKNATDLAKYTAFSEKDTTTMAQYILKSGLLPTKDDLMQVGNLGSLKPELGVEHAGFAIFDWLNGRVTPLKTNYGIDNEVLREYLKNLPDKKDFSKAFNKKGAVGDKEQAFNLLMRYMNDNYGNLALTQSRTLRGRFSTLEGMFQQFGAKLIGLNNETGTVTNENGVYARIGNFLGSRDDNGNLSGILKTLDDFTKSPVITEFQNIMGDFVGSLLDSLGRVITVSNLEQFTGVINRIGSSLKSLLDKAKDMNVFEKIVDAIVSAGNSFADMLQKFSESEAYEKFLENLPDLIKQSLEYESAKLELAMSLSQYIPALINLMDKTTNFINKISGGQEAVARAGDIDDSDETRSQWNRLNGNVRSAKDGVKVEAVNDFNAIRYLTEKEKELSLSTDQIQRAISVIKTDDSPNYNIELSYAGGKLDEAKLKESFEQWIISTLEEADSNS